MIKIMISIPINNVYNINDKYVCFRKKQIVLHLLRITDNNYLYV